MKLSELKEKLSDEKQFPMVKEIKLNSEDPEAENLAVTLNTNSLTKLGDFIRFLRLNDFVAHLYLVNTEDSETEIIILPVLR